ncbi:MAG: galactonate dehydratase [Desulfuromonadales bacterium]|nr:galactonate dehydratase [Desulfuromonadales bacterium]
MKITAIKPIIVNAAMRNWIFVRVETDQPGLYGWGEATLEWKTRGVVGALEDLEPLVIGHDPRQINQLVRILKKQSFWRLGVIGSSAASGIELACWDIWGKSLGVPVWQLLGGKVRDKVKVYTHLGMGQMEAVYESLTEEPLLARAQEVREHGYRAMKIVNIPYTHYSASLTDLDNLSRMTAKLREIVGPECEIMIDFHGRPASARAALQYVEAVAAARPLFIEEPVQPGDTAGLKFVHQHSPVPVASGERLIDLADFSAIFEARAVDIAQPDLCHCGGISEARKIAAMAESVGIGLAPHNPAGPVAGAAALHFAIATPNHVIQEEMVGAVPWYRDVVSQTSVQMAEGHWMIPETPGLGIDINMKEAAKYPFKQEPIHTANAKISDGSIVDW